MKTITILIVDDHRLVRETWGYILNSDRQFKVIAECGSGEEGVELARQLRPDIVIMDVNLPGITGIEATSLIRKFAPASRILGVSFHSQPAYAKKMLQTGARGYITKNSSSEEMFEAIMEVYNGKKFICGEIKDKLSEQMIEGDNNSKGMDALSHREIEIINLIKNGLTSKEIADSLGISAKTVEVHRYNILKKLDLKNAAALVHFINSHIKWAS